MSSKSVPCCVCKAVMEMTLPLPVPEADAICDDCILRYKLLFDLLDWAGTTQQLKRETVLLVVKELGEIAESHCRSIAESRRLN